MEFEKVWSGRIDTAAAGGPRKYSLPARAGGRKAKVMQVMVKILAASVSTVTVTAYVEHGPDGTVWTAHSTAIAATAVTGTYPYLLAGDTDDSIVLGEYLRVTLEANDTGGALAWAQVEVFELRKPF